MKRTYNQPACLVVQLGTLHILAESLPVGSGGGTITNPEEILVKEDNSVRDVNVWDEEW